MRQGALTLACASAGKHLPHSLTYLKTNFLPLTTYTPLANPRVSPPERILRPLRSYTSCGSRLSLSVRPIPVTPPSSTPSITKDILAPAGTPEVSIQVRKPRTVLIALVVWYHAPSDAPRTNDWAGMSPSSVFSTYVPRNLMLPVGSTTCSLIPVSYASWFYVTLSGFVG